MMIEDRIAAALQKHYGFSSMRIEPASGGWSAKAFNVITDNKKYFLKVYDKKRDSVRQWIEAIDRYTPLVKWLHDNTVLYNYIINPILTNDKKYKCEDEDSVYILAEYIEGAIIGENRLNNRQIEELAMILGELHKSTSYIPYRLKNKQIKENFQIEFCRYLYDFINNDLYKIEDGLYKIIEPYTGCILNMIEQIMVLSGSLKRKNFEFVLCHCDAHNWNIIQGDNLILIDWECLKLAPKEQDLILNITKPYAAQFISEYKKHVDYDKPDLDAFEFYLLKRYLLDLWEWIKQLRLEGLVRSERETLGFLESSLEQCSENNDFRDDLKNTLIDLGYKL